LGEKLKTGFLKSALSMKVENGDSDHERKLEEEFTKGNSLASKVMEDLFKKQKAQMSEADARRKKE
jgi:hypothetical protein